MRWRALIACGRQTRFLQQQIRSVRIETPRGQRTPHAPNWTTRRRDDFPSGIARRFDRKTRQVQKYAGGGTYHAKTEETGRRQQTGYGSNEQQSTGPSQSLVESLRGLDGQPDAIDPEFSKHIPGGPDTARAEKQATENASGNVSGEQKAAPARPKVLTPEELKAKLFHGGKKLHERIRSMDASEDGSEADDLVSQVAQEKKLYAKHKYLEFWDAATASPSLNERIFANKFFTKHPTELLFTAGKLHQMTLTDVPEVAFVGRSNAGKSTLMNAICGNKVAFISKHPGRTRTLNAWAVGGRDRTGRKHKLTVLDMPGYGHKSRQAWGNTVTHYLTKRKELKRVFVLVSAEHGLKSNDKDMLKALRDAAIPHQVILSQIDRLIYPPHKKRTNAKLSRLQKVVGREHMRQLQQRMESIIGNIEKESAKGGLPTSKDVLCCAGQSFTIPGEHPDPVGTMGISALRWSILNAAGLQPHAKVRDEKEFSF